MTEIYALDPGFPGAGRVLKELSKVFPKVRYIDLAAPIHSETKPPAIIFLPAWHPQYSGLLKIWAEGDNQIVQVWTSPPLQSEMVPQELEYLRTILYFLGSGKIHALWIGDKNWLPIIKKEGHRVFYAPYPASLPQQVVSRELQPVKNVSLFGPLHPRKNVLTQAIAAKVADVHVHITDHSGASILDGVGVGYTNHGWLPEDQYEKLLLEHIDLGLQVSLPGVESRSFVCWDHISRGIPCLSSVDWVPPHLRVTHSDPEAIAYWIRNRWKVQDDPTELRKWAEGCSQRWNRECREILERELGITLI